MAFTTHDKVLGFASTIVRVNAMEALIGFGVCEGWGDAGQLLSSLLGHAGYYQIMLARVGQDA